MHWLIPLFILVFFEFIADILAKEWSVRGFPLVLAVGSLLAYMLANTSWLYALKYGSGLARGAVVFSIASAVLATFIGLVMYHEEVTKIQVFGIVLGLIAIAFIFWE